MKKLLLPLIILLLIIGYFMSRGGDHAAKDAYDSLNKPKSEDMENMNHDQSPDQKETPPDGMGKEPDSNMQESDQPDSMPPGGQNDTDMMDKAKDAASDMGDDAKDAAEKAGKAVEEAGDKTKEAAEDLMDKMKDKDKDKEKDEEPQN